MQQRDLVERARRGDHDAFSVLARAAFPRLDATARLIIRDRETAQDAVQEAIVRLWHDLPDLRDPDRFDAWMYRILVNACYRELRRNRRRSMEVELNPLIQRSISDGSASLADRDAIERGFRRLDPEQRAIVVLTLYLGLSIPEAADVLSVPQGTAKSRLHRALAKLRAALDADARTNPTLAGERAP
jgi:RNA polymerase sigma-70 factor, ECF subfamily